MSHSIGQVSIRYVKNTGFSNEYIVPEKNSPLDQRRWTLPERVRSTRGLSFGKEKMFWECNHQRYPESLHYPIYGEPIAEIFPALRKTDLHSIHNDMRYRRWYKLLDEYGPAQVELSNGQTSRNFRYYVTASHNDWAQISCGHLARGPGQRIDMEQHFQPWSC